MVCSRLSNCITFNAMGLQWILAWQILQCYNVWFCTTIKYSGLTILRHHHYVPINQVKIEKERKKWGEIRGKTSPPLDPAAVSAGGWHPPAAGEHQEACPFSFYILRMPVIPPQGRSTVAQNVGAGGSWLSHSPLCRAGLQPHSSI